MTYQRGGDSARSMTKTDTLFVTRIYRSALRGRGTRTLNDELRQAALTIAAEDIAGQSWSREKGYKGYTSYASLADLTWRMPEFSALQTHLDDHVATFAEDLEFDLGGDALSLDSMWVNILEPGGVHGSHIHPHSVISGTYYVDVPEAASAIRFEDPRLAMMMAAPPRRKKAQLENKTFVSIQPKVGTLLLWESWLRHEVPMNMSKQNRISISFNYGMQTTE